MFLYKLRLGTETGTCTTFGVDFSYSQKILKQQIVAIPWKAFFSSTAKNRTKANGPGDPLAEGCTTEV